MLKHVTYALSALLIGLGPARAEPAHLSEDYRLIFRDGSDVMSPEHSLQNAKALEKLAVLMRRFGGRKDVRVMAMAGESDAFAVDRFYAVRSALRTSYKVAFKQLESLGLSQAGPAGKHLRFALMAEDVRNEGCPWDLIVDHPGLDGSAKLRIAAGIESTIHLPKGGRVMAESVSALPHSLAFAFTSETTGYVIDEDGAGTEAELRLTVSSLPITMPEVSRSEPLFAKRAVGNFIQGPQLVEAPPESVICSIQLVYSN